MLIAIYMTLSLAIPASATQNATSVMMAVNETTLVADGVSYQMTPPVLVLGKTYVNLYAVAPRLGLDVTWVEAAIGYFHVEGNGQNIDFKRISSWEDLTWRPYQFFVKDGEIYVSVRELAQISGYPLTYQNGLITLGELCNLPDWQIRLSDCNDDVYTRYPLNASYIVNPYQAYSYENMLSDAKRLQGMHPDLIKTSSIGKSVEGRELLLIEFGRGDTKIFVNGTHHGREYISTTYLMYAIDRYACAYRNNSMWGQYSPKEILDQVTFCIVPMVNPDGVNLVQNGISATDHAEELAQMGIYEGAKYGYSAWKANIRGVDLNRNYNQNWSAKTNRNPRGSVGFHGDAPNSEPEVIAISDYVDTHPFDAYVAFHTQGEVFYWEDDPVNPTHLEWLLKRDTGFTKVTDTETDTDDGGTFFDYVYQRFQKPTLTVELCPYVGNFPYPDRNFDTVWKPAKNILLLVANEILYQKSLR